MAVVRSSLSSIDVNQGKANQTAQFPQVAYTEWVRNPEWLTLTAPGSSEQKFVGLFAVYNNNSNYLGFVCQGAVTVDWGDGTTNNYASGALTSKQYTFSSISSSTQTTQGYRQVIVTITPQAGQNLTYIDLNRQNSRTNMRGNVPWLDIAIAGPNLTTLGFASTFLNNTLERVNLVSSAMTSFQQMFQNCRALQSVTVNTSATLTNVSQMFNDCRNLQVAPFFNTSTVTNFSQMFINCSNLTVVPTYNTVAATNVNQMFNSCFKLRYIPFFNFSNVTNNMDSFANKTYALIDVPPLDVSKCTSFVSAFSESGITKIPNFNFAAATNVSNMFNTCRSLRYVPPLVLPVVTNATSMFANCSGLERVDSLKFNASGATNLSTLFDNCIRLKTVGSITAVNCTNTFALFNINYDLSQIDSLSFGSNLANASYMFQQCLGLTVVPLFTTSSVTNAEGMFYDCNAMTTLPNFNFSAVTNAYNMFRNMFALANFPSGVTLPTAATNMSAMFFQDVSLQFAPAINTSSATNVSFLFSGCSGLTNTPTSSLGAVTSAANQDQAFTGTLSSLAVSTVTGTKFTISYANSRLAGAQLDTIYTNLATLNPAVTNASGNGTTVTYTVGTSGIPAFVAGRTVTITGVDPVAYNLTGVTVASVNAGAGTFTVTNAATGTYVSGGVASITSDRTITVTGNHGTPDDTPSIATNKGWTVTGS